MPTVKVSDLYHAAYLVANGCEIVAVECQMFMDKATCTLVFTGERVDELTETYARREAMINLYTFRQAYVRVNEFVMETKRTRERAQRAKRVAAKGGVTGGAR